MTYSAYLDEGKDIQEENLFEEVTEPKEFNLNDFSLPVGFVTGIMSMRKKEHSKLFVRAKYACK